MCATRSLTVWALALSVVAPGLAPLPALARGRAGSDAVKGEQLSRQQFQALPDNAAIEHRGQRSTKAEIVAKAAQRRAAAAAKIQAAVKDGRAKGDRQRAQFLQEQQSRLEADNAKARAEFDRLRQTRSAAAPSLQRDAIRQEAAQLWQRYQGASPAERARIDQRADELLKQLQQSGR